jgi:hypothetical protein
MPLLPAAWKGCDFLITIEISFSEIDMGEGISVGYEALGMLERLASGIRGKNCALRALAFSEGVVALPEGVTRLRINEGVGRRWLLVFAYFASCHMPLLPLAALARACLKCTASAFLIASHLALSASRKTLQASAHGRVVCHLLTILTFLTSWVSSLGYHVTQK